MSKKSRRRNRRLLMMAALAGGAALAGRGKGTAFPRPDAGTIDQMAADATPKTNYITKKADTAVVAPINKNKFRTRGRITDSAGNTIDSAGMTLNRRIPGATAPPGILNPYRRPVGGGHPLAKGRLFRKKGGSVKKAKVTGIAKRGFGRALMKGKK
jgi:hypothetical protein